MVDRLLNSGIIGNTSQRILITTIRSDPSVDRLLNSGIIGNLRFVLVEALLP